MVEQLTQLIDGGSNPTLPLQFYEPCSAKDIKKFVEKYHYSHSLAGANDYCFKITVNGNLVGAAAFGLIGGNPLAQVLVKGFDNPLDYRELRRVALLDECPKNSETKFIAWCLKWLKKNTNLIGIISFADPRYGHTGVIYKAGNWIKAGMQKPDGTRRLIVNGKEMHPRSVYAKYGTWALPKLREMGHNVELVYHQPKYRYVYILRKGLEIKDRLRENL